MRLIRRIGHHILTLLVSLALVLSLPLSMPSDSYAVSKFGDISGHWAEGYITRAYNQDIVNGYPGGRFYPDKSVTRAEFVSMINNAFDLDIDHDNTAFNDVTYDKWYYKAVSTAVAAAYAGGFSDNTFHPDVPITRQEAAVMLSKILPNYKGGGNLKSYRDYRLIATWATAALEKMTGREYFGAYSDGRLHPADPLTRAQAAKILSDILDNETIVTDETEIDKDETTLSERIYTDDVTIDEDLGKGSATIDNCVILGKLIVEGGGAESITINNSRIASVVMDKEDGAVRLVTKGSTVIPKLSASDKSILQTAGKDGYGILSVAVNKGADVTLKGNFPKVDILGSTATVALESGKINTLTVTAAGRYSDITLTGKAQLQEAAVNAECYFHGEGVISHMTINADDVTYETKPVKMTVGTTVDRAMEEGNMDVDVTFEPRNRETDVDVEADITLTFASSMKLADGKAISDSNIKDFVSLKKDSKSGSDVEFTAAINSAKKIITISPKSDLAVSTKYYIMLKEEALMNFGGSLNEDETSYFTTSSKGGSTSATFSPANGATGVLSSKLITIKFKEDVVNFSDGGAVTAAYLQECVQFKNGSASGTNVTYTASISSADTITITPSSSLTAGEVYYVGLVADKLKTKDGGNQIPEASATWTVAASTPAVYAILSTLTVGPADGGDLLTGFTGSTTTYDVSVPFGTTNIDIRATAAVGTVIELEGMLIDMLLNQPIPSDSITTINASASADSMITRNYEVNIEVAGNTALSAISINGTALLPGADTYSANVVAAATDANVSVTADDPNATIIIDGSTGTGSLTTDVDLAAGNQTITFKVISNMTEKTYEIHFSRLAP